VPFCPWQGGKLHLDPTRCWCVRSALLSAQYSNSGGQTRYDVVLADGAAPLCVPLRVVLRQSGYEIPDEKTSRKVPLERVHETEFDLKGPDYSAASDDFRLAAFGLPEPMGFTPPQRSRWYLWFGLAGGILLCVGCWVGRKRIGHPAAR
jgi:hypothetical protein